MQDQICAYLSPHGPKWLLSELRLVQVQTSAMKNMGFGLDTETHTRTHTHTHTHRQNKMTGASCRQDTVTLFIAIEFLSSDHWSSGHDWPNNPVE